MPLNGDQQRNSFSPTSTADPRPGLRFVILIVATTLVSLMMSLRLYQDRAPMASFLRFLSRGVLFAVLGTLGMLAVGAGVAVVRQLVGGRKLPKQIFKDLAVVGSLLGMAANTGITWHTTSLDPEIIRRMNELAELRGFIELRVPQLEPITLMQTNRGGYLRREPLDAELPPFIAALAGSAEDKRFAERLFSFDPEAIVRATAHAVDGQRQGGSGFPEQLAGLLFDLHPKGFDLNSLQMKSKKFLIGIRTDELYRRDEIVRAYLAVAPFNSMAGFELSGIEAAARAFFGCRARDLTIAQAAILLSMLPNPAHYFPYQRSGESDEKFQLRINHLRERATSVINNAMERGGIPATEATQARGELLAGLLPYDQAVSRLRRPKLRAIFEELSQFPDLKERSAIAEVVFNEKAQSALEQAVDSALAEICLLPAVARHGCNDVAIDAVVLSANGGIVAETGLTTVAGGGSSIIKPAHAAAALESGLMVSVHDDIPGTHIRLDEMLFHSINEGAERLSQRLGAARMVPFLEQSGFVIPANRVSEKNALGAGAWVTPRNAAQAYVFHYGAAPGATAPARLVVGIKDRLTGAVVFRAAGTQIVSKRTALAIRAALQETPIQGSARGALHELAASSPIAVKTGTSAFFSKAQRRIVGEGGSWTLAADSRSCLSVAVRARYRSGAPFEPNGGASAALVVRDFLNRIRQISANHDLEVAQ